MVKEAPHIEGPSFFEGPMFELDPIQYKTKKQLSSVGEAMVPFVEHFGVYVLSGDPIGKNPAKSLAEFVKTTEKPVCGYYFSKRVAASSGLKALRVGVSHHVDLKAAQINGYKFRDWRRAQNKTLGYELVEPSAEEAMNIEKAWWRTKVGPRIRFILSALVPKPAQGERRFGLKSPQGELVAFVSLFPFGDGGWYVDQLIQRPKANRFALDRLLVEVIFLLKNEGHSVLSLGLSPFKDLQTDELLGKVVFGLDKLNIFYRSEGLYHFKRKFTDIEEPRYLLFDPCTPIWRQVAALTKATYT